MFKRHVIQELSSYLDNQLAEKEKLKVEAHLKDCAFCQKELSHLRLLSEKLKTWQVPELGPFFADAVKQEIAQQGLERPKMKTKKWYILIPSGVLAGILVFAFLGNFYVRRGLQARIGIVERGMIGRWKPTADNIGRQFYPPSGYETARQTDRERRDVATGATSTIDGGVINYLEGDAWGTDYSDRNKDEPYYISKGAYNGVERGITGQYSGRGELIVNGMVVAGLAQLPSSEVGPVIVVQPVLPATGIGDKIIRTAEVRLEVEDASLAYTKVSAICQELGGYLAASNFHKDQEGRQAGTITMRIPKDNFLTALNKINALGKVENSSSQSQDVSQEYANLKNQLETAMIIYNKMMEALQKRQVTIPEAMHLESELSPILRRVEDLKNRIDYLNNAISFTTVTVNFHEPQVSLKVLKDSKQNIQKSMLAATIGAIQFLAKAIPVTIAVVIWLAIILGIVVVLKNWITRLFKRE
jgi:predicted kinase